MAKILVLNPNTSRSMTGTIDSALTRFSETVDVSVRNVPWGPLSVESETDNILAASAVVDTVWRFRQDYDGFVIACFDDPGLEACRELIAQPVVGIGESAIGAAAASVDRVGVIIVDTRVQQRVTAHCVRNGLPEDRLLFGSLNGTVLDLNQSSSGVSERFTRVGQDLIAEGAEALVLACAGFSDQAESLESLTGVPIFDGNICGVERVKALIDAGFHSDRRIAPQAFVGTRSEIPAWVSATENAERKEESL